MKNKIEIAFSKTKIIWLLIGSLAFVFAGIAILSSMDTMLYEKIIAVTSILFFGSGLFLFPGKLVDKTPGMIINKDGITDNITKPRIGTIYWNDISHVEISKIYSTKMLLIFVHNPGEYLKRVDGLNSRG